MAICIWSWAVPDFLVHLNLGISDTLLNVLKDISTQKGKACEKSWARWLRIYCIIQYIGFSRQRTLVWLCKLTIIIIFNSNVNILKGLDLLIRNVGCNPGMAAAANIALMKHCGECGPRCTPRLDQGIHNSLSLH